MWTSLRPDAAAVLKDKMARESLNRYFSVMQNEKTAKFMIARKLTADFRKGDPTPKLWEIHDRLLEKYCVLENETDSHLKSVEQLETPHQSFLDLKIEIANRIMESCHFCIRQCGVNRSQGEKGYCKCGDRIAVSSMFEHMGEEPELVPSGTIFTMGCTLRCCHCQNWAISQWTEQGEIYSPESLAKAVEHLRSNGCRNANLVGGDPTPWLAQWLATFRHVSTNVPVVWNSNSYYSEEAAKLLAGFVDVYLLDFKYGNNKCAKRISDAQDYWEACTRNHIYGRKYGELLIRVLVLPDHLDCCVKPILGWISGNLGSKTRTNIMFQYRPEWRAQQIPELRRGLTPAEREKAFRLAGEAGLLNFIT
jgi:putative pyruvate formate lyase activating enzyme